MCTYYDFNQDKLQSTLYGQSIWSCTASHFNAYPRYGYGLMQQFNNLDISGETIVRYTDCPGSDCYIIFKFIFRIKKHWAFNSALKVSQTKVLRLYLRILKFTF